MDEKKRKQDTTSSTKPAIKKRAGGSGLRLADKIALRPITLVLKLRSWPAGRNCTLKPAQRPKHTEADA